MGKGCIFRTTSTVEEIAVVLEKLELKPGSALYDFVNDLLMRTRDRDVKEVTQTELEASGFTRSTIVSRARRLEKLGVIQSFRVGKGHDQRVVYELKPSLDQFVAETELVPADDEREEHAGTVLLARPQVFKGEAFSVFTLFPLLPFGRGRSSVNQEYDGEIVLGRERMKVTISPMVGTNVASILDTRVLLVILSMVVAQHSPATPVTNPVILSIDDICEALGYTGRNKTGAVREYVMEAISRWESTGFKITASTPGFPKYFENHLELHTRFRLFSRITVLSTVNDNGNTPELLKVFIDELTLKRLLKEEKNFLLSVHPSVLQEKNATALKLYYWARRTIKHDSEVRRIQIKDVMREIDGAGRRTDIFRANVRSLLKERKEEASTPANIHGYLMDYDERTDEILVRASPSDPLLGQNSFYARLRKTRQLVSELDDSDD